jgi:hypothetical protein
VWHDRQTTRPVPGKTGRKPKLVMLNRVTYRKPGVFLGSNAYFKTFMRFTVRACIFKTSERFAIWDTKRGDWLFQDKRFRTRAGAREYLRRTTVENQAYKLAMLNHALDKGAA